MTASAACLPAGWSRRACCRSALRRGSTRWAAAGRRGRLGLQGWSAWGACTCGQLVALLLSCASSAPPIQSLACWRQHTTAFRHNLCAVYRSSAGIQLGGAGWLRGQHLALSAAHLAAAGAGGEQRVAVLAAAAVLRQTFCASCRCWSGRGGGGWPADCGPAVPAVALLCHQQPLWACCWCGRSAESWELAAALLCWLHCCCAVASHALACLLLDCAQATLRLHRPPPRSLDAVCPPAAPCAQVALIAELQRLQKEAAATAGATAAGAAASAAAAGAAGSALGSLAAAYAPAAGAAAPAAVAPDPDLAAALKGLRTEIRLLRARRVLRTLGLVQDLADLLMVLAEVRPSKSGLLSRPAVLALAGLLSGCLSAYKNWPGH